MKLAKFFILLSILGIISGINVVSKSKRNESIAEPLVEPAKPPFETFVAGAGIIEANTENINIATQISGVVTEIPVTVGQEIKAGDPLFTIDNSQILAEIEVKNAEVNVAKAEVEESRQQLTLLQKVLDKRAVSAEEYTKRLYALKVQEAKLKFAESAVASLNTELQRHTVRSPIDGTVLQVKIKIGEFAGPQSSGQSQTNSTNSLMIVGNIKPMNVRVDIDENDAWKINGLEKNNKKIAKGYLRGNPQYSFDLELVRIEPYVVPKKSLTGESAERVDTRVMQVVFQLQENHQKLSVGQLVDVFISI